MRLWRQRRSLFVGKSFVLFVKLSIGEDVAQRFAENLHRLPASSPTPLSRYFLYKRSTNPS